MPVFNRKTEASCFRGMTCHYLSQVRHGIRLRAKSSSRCKEMFHRSLQVEYGDVVVLASKELLHGKTTYEKVASDFKKSRDARISVWGSVRPVEAKLRARFK